MPEDDLNHNDLTTFNLVASAALVLFGLLALFYLIPEHVRASAADDQGLSARFMPTVAASAFTLLAAILGLNVLVRMLRGLPPFIEENEDNDVQGFGRRECLNTLALLSGTAVYVGLLSTVGFIVASTLGLATCLYLGANRNWLLIAGLSIGLPLLLVQLLWWLLTIQVPVFTLFE